MTTKATARETETDVQIPPRPPFLTSLFSLGSCDLTGVSLPVIVQFSGDQSDEKVTKMPSLLSFC